MNIKRGQGGFINIVGIIGVILLVYIFLEVKDNSHVQFFWKAFTHNIEQMHDGQANDWQLAAPIVTFK